MTIVYRYQCFWWILALIVQTRLYGSTRLYGANAFRLLVNAHSNHPEVDPEVEDATHKEITFIRHGESLGNLLGKKPGKYAAETGLSFATGWKDGRLSEGGKTATIERVSEFDESLVDRILDAELVLVSPLIRAMETCILVLTAAVNRKGIDPNVLDKMNFVVKSDLREKLSSDSDKPGAGNADIGEYLVGVAKTQATWAEPMARKLYASYEVEERRTNSFEDDPDNAQKFLAAIMRFRNDLDSFEAKNVLIIGHNGWSRWTFAAGLKGACTEDKENNAAFGGRQVQELANVGVLTAKLSNSKFQDFSVFNGNAEKNNCKKTKFAMFSSLEEAKDAGVLAPDASVHRGLTLKKMDSFGYKGRWITFSATGSHSMLAWGDEMAEPKKFIDLTLAEYSSELKYACDLEQTALHLSSSTKELNARGDGDRKLGKVQPFHMHVDPAQPEALADFKRICLLMHIHTEFAVDSNFIATIFKETEWDKGLSDGALDVLLSQKLPEWKQRWELKGGGRLPFRVQEVTGGAELEELRRDTGGIDLATMFSNIPKHPMIRTPVISD